MPISPGEAEHRYNKLKDLTKIYAEIDQQLVEQYAFLIAPGEIIFMLQSDLTTHDINRIIDVYSHQPYNWVVRKGTDRQLLFSLPNGNNNTRETE